MAIKPLPFFMYNVLASEKVDLLTCAQRQNAISVQFMKRRGCLDTVFTPSHGFSISDSRIIHTGPIE